MKRGIRFEVPNEYGRIIADVLEPIKYNLYNWHIENDEIHRIVEGKISQETLFTEQIIDGVAFSDRINNNTYYTVFLELKAFPKGVPIAEIYEYEDFVNSECEIVMLVADCTFTDVYCKNAELIIELYNNAKIKGFENIEYIDESDTRTRLHVF